MNAHPLSSGRLHRTRERIPARRAAGFALALSILMPLPCSAFTAVADTSGGYGFQVLNQIMRTWKQPAGARGTVLMELRIEPSGALADCSILQPSLSPTADAALCAAAHNAAPYPYAPFGAEAKVSLAAAYSAGEPGAAEAPAPTYAEMLRQSISPHLIVPHGLSGSWTTVVQLDVWADGTIKDCRITRPSGNAAVDAAVMEAIRTPGVISAPPEHMEQRVSLSFTLSAR